MANPYFLLYLQWKPQPKGGSYVCNNHLFCISLQAVMCNGDGFGVP